QVTDEAGKVRTSTSDAAGRLTQVVEDPSGLDYLTTYNYDTLDDLTAVHQGGSNGQTRSFVYDSLKRLTRSTNPESNTISYQYDADGNELGHAVFPREVLREGWLLIETDPAVKGLALTGEVPYGNGPVRGDAGPQGFIAVGPEGSQLVAGATVTADAIGSNGCHIVTCANGAGNITAMACNKPGDYQPAYFELYFQSANGAAPDVCIGTTCLGGSGYAKSPSFPICVGNATSPPPPPPPPPTNQTCYASLQNIPANCTGGTITSDTYNGCRAITCTNGGDSIQVLACDKPSSTNPSYFEMYKQAQTGSTQFQVCLAGTCISDNGYAKSPSYPVCTNGTGNTTGPPPPPPPPPNGTNQTGNISVTTTPGGATIALDGNAAGTTGTGASGSLAIANVSPGLRNLSAAAAGYITYQTTVNVVAGQTTSLSVTLQQQGSTNGTGSISLTTAPGSAIVSLDGSPAGVTDPTTGSL
ncbi:MAG: hypothetical protein B7X11_03425, partial [Acidobacteria bacterium 37-65-4]